MKVGVGVIAEDNVASAIRGAVVGVCGQVVEKLVHGNIGDFSGSGQLGTQDAEGGKELVLINCTCVVEESTNDALNYLDTFCGERRAVGVNMG